MSCIFCRVASGEVPAAVVKREGRLLAFKDVNPQAPTHILVIPVAHVRTLDDADPALLGELFTFAREVARDAGLSDPGYRIVVNTNTHGGQTVFHLHLHVLGGRAMTWPPG